MLAFWKRELRSYFDSPVGYIFVAALLCMLGLHTYLLCIVQRMPVFEQVLGSSALIFLLMVPILTMRTFSEERRNGLFPFYYSLPISMGSLVVGKYLALLTVLTLPLALSLLYPVILGQFGTLNFGIIGGTFLGFFGMGAALLAIGLFCSVLVENQAAASALTFLLLLLGYVSPMLAPAIPGSAAVTFAVLVGLALCAALLWLAMTRNFTGALSVALVLTLPLSLLYRFFPAALEGKLHALLGGLSMYARLYRFEEGILDISTLVYYGSVTVLFLFLSVQILEYRRCR